MLPGLHQTRLTQQEPRSSGSYTGYHWTCCSGESLGSRQPGEGAEYGVDPVWSVLEHPSEM